MFLSVCFLSFYCLHSPSYTAKIFQRTKKKRKKRNVWGHEAAAWLEDSGAPWRSDTSKLEADGRDIPQLVPMAAFLKRAMEKKKKKKSPHETQFLITVSSTPIHIWCNPNWTRHQRQPFPWSQITRLLGCFFYPQETAQGVPTLSRIHGVAKQVCYFIIQPWSQLLTAASRTQMEPWMINQINHRWCNSLPTTHNNQKVCNVPLMNYLYGWGCFNPSSTPPQPSPLSLSLETSVSWNIAVLISGWRAVYTITRVTVNISVMRRCKLIGRNERKRLTTNVETISHRGAATTKKDTCSAAAYFIFMRPRNASRWPRIYLWY